jgi:hypothetical protein
MNRATAKRGTQRSQIRQFPAADGIPPEPRLLLQRFVRQVDRFAAEIHQRQPARQMRDRPVPASKRNWQGPWLNAAPRWSGYWNFPE